MSASEEMKIYEDGEAALAKKQLAKVRHDLGESVGAKSVGAISIGALNVAQPAAEGKKADAGAAGKKREVISAADVEAAALDAMHGEPDKGEGEPPARRQKTVRLKAANATQMEEAAARMLGFGTSKRVLISNLRQRQLGFNTRRYKELVDEHTSWARVHATDALPGAATDVESMLPWLIETYTRLGLWQVPQEAQFILAPWVLDNRYVCGKNEGLSFAFRQVAKGMSPKHSMEIFSVLTKKEKFADLTGLDQELRLAEQRAAAEQVVRLPSPWTFFRPDPCLVQVVELPDGRTLPIRCPIVCDFNACSAVANNVGSPKLTTRGDRLCFCCGFDVPEKMGNWMIHPDKFWQTVHTQDGDPPTLLGAKVEEIVWEGLHVMNRVVDTTISA